MIYEFVLTFLVGTSYRQEHVEFLVKNKADEIGVNRFRKDCDRLCYDYSMVIRPANS